MSAGLLALLALVVIVGLYLWLDGPPDDAPQPPMPGSPVASVLVREATPEDRAPHAPAPQGIQIRAATPADRPGTRAGRPTTRVQTRLNGSPQCGVLQRPRDTCPCPACVATRAAS